MRVNNMIWVEHTEKKPNIFEPHIHKYTNKYEPVEIVDVPKSNEIIYQVRLQMDEKD